MLTCTQSAPVNCAHSTKTTAILERLALLRPTTLACQHGSVYGGDGAALLRQLAAIFETELRADEL